MKTRKELKAEYKRQEPSIGDAIEEIYKIAVAEKFDIAAEPEDTAYGQRRLLLKDPNGAMVDVSSPIKDFLFQ